MRSSRWARQRLESLFQSSAVGVRSSGSVARASRISASGMPVRWATLITETRRRTSRAYLPLIATVTPALDQALSLVEVKGRDSDAAASGHFADGKRLVDSGGPSIRHFGLPLDLKFT